MGLGKRGQPCGKFRQPLPGALELGLQIGRQGVFMGERRFVGLSD